jgi:diguanylate cyclase (GGDEF)-like protein
MLDQWRSQSIATISLVGGLLVAQVFLTLLLYREFRRRELAENSYRKLAADLNALAHIDKLTSLPNRRKFDQDFDIEWRRMMRNRSCLSLLLIDIDHFKSYNDTYGHQAGDIALQAVARCIASAIRRPGDLAARYGGEEFVVILPDTPRDGANVVACGIHAALAAANLAYSASDHGRITVSIGISTAMHGPDAGSISCLEAADAALYEAKEQGRNRIVVSQALVALT